MARRLRIEDERGIALIMALGVLIVFSILVTGLATYTSTNARSVRFSKSQQLARSIAEAGVNDAIGVLNQTTNNALDTALLPARTTSYEGGTATWSGTLNQQTATWTITSTGTVFNPSGASNITKTITVNVAVTPTLSQTLNNQAWNYIYSFKANDGNSSTCEMTIANSVNVATPLYVNGDLCINQTALITQGTHGTSLVVGGRVTLSSANQNFVGATKSGNTVNVNRITAAYIGNGCVLGNNSAHSPCGSADNVYATTIGTTPPSSVSPPNVDWSGWYNAASPGPKFGCVAARSSASSTWPVFESTGNTAVDKSVTTAWNLTPSTSYDCWTDGGELAWNPTTRVLTVNGTVFIDGSAYIQNGSVNSYSGEGTMYLYGTFLLKNSKLCALVTSDGSACDTTNWDPNTKALVIVAHGNADNGVSSGDSVQLISAYFQGGIYATNNIELDTTSNVDGPMVASTVILGQSVNTSFPFINFVPTGTPGNPVVYAQPLAPTNFSGG
jgi:Tfp pilus assembly protein PilX